MHRSGEGADFIYRKKNPVAFIGETMSTVLWYTIPFHPPLIGLLCFLDAILTSEDKKGKSCS